MSLQSTFILIALGHHTSKSTLLFPLEPRFVIPTVTLNLKTLLSLIDKALASDSDLLDDYIEAHIHGEISVKDDIECIVLDPIFRASSIEQQAVNLGVPVKWHNGYELSLE
ncbi:hypothetical protein VCRA2123O444_140046 [Vibrio crassostreae]|nr:hypothetical protein VCRA2113O411_100025 [Vibrio crassostreae]CAK1693924.1 hypothetical protein VCRA2118O429_100025 [Vibrio crassostreae]CAK1694122.1 hypothetical protein VCRA2113O412_100025 [Vibrio crassostreae]CAK1694313.1 hypothetical protein VCRA2114O421_100026 [Vibrio crassostreae]CAK1708248.1 hypothetical protein VCRA2113O414_100157 [Vibrio crassostreae]